MVVFADLCGSRVSQMQNPVFDRHFTIWGNDVNVIRLYTHAILHLHHGHGCGPGEDFSQLALPRGIKVQHHHIGHAEVAMVPP